MSMPTTLYVYRARLVRVVDGDTIDVVLDQGLHAQRLERLRLFGVNAPETHVPTREAGDAATAYAEAWLAVAGWPGPPDWPLVVQTFKSDVFGRYLAMVYRVVDGACLNGDLLTTGHAVEDIR